MKHTWKKPKRAVDLTDEQRMWLIDIIQEIIWMETDLNHWVTEKHWTVEMITDIEFAMASVGLRPAMSEEELTQESIEEAWENMDD